MRDERRKNNDLFDFRDHHIIPAAGRDSEVFQLQARALRRVFELGDDKTSNNNNNNS